MLRRGFVIFVCAVLISILSSYGVPWLLQASWQNFMSVPLLAALIALLLSSPRRALLWVFGLGIGMDLARMPAPPYHLMALAAAGMVVQFTRDPRIAMPLWLRRGVSVSAASAAYFAILLAAAFLRVAWWPSAGEWRIVCFSIIGHAIAALLCAGAVRAALGRTRAFAPGS